MDPFRCRLDGSCEREKPNPEPYLREASYSEGASRDLCFGEGLTRRSVYRQKTGGAPHLLNGLWEL
jgi:hypothetical protein